MMGKIDLVLLPSCVTSDRLLDISDSLKHILYNVYYNIICTLCPHLKENIMIGVEEPCS